MRDLAPAVAARRAARTSTHAEVLVWVSAKNRTTGAMETMGLWTGDDHSVFTIRGQDRTYYGAGNVLQVPAIQAVIGLEVRTLQVSLAAVSPEVELLVRGYDPRFAPCEIHRAEYDDDGNLLAAPERVFKGWVNGAPISTPAVGGSGGIALDLVSNARMLTRYGAATKSDQQQRRREGDRFRRYATLPSASTVYWGEEHMRPGSGAAVVR